MMCATNWVERYRTVFSFDVSNGSELDRMCEVNREVGVSEND